MPREACSGLWRSEDMVVLSLHMQREVAHDAVLKLGEIGQFQFEDLNKDVSAFQRDFVQEVRRCDDMERKLRFLQEESEKAGVATIVDGDAEGETMSSLEHKIDEVYSEVVELNEQYQALIEERNRSKEHLEILSRDFGGATGDGVLMVTGVIPKERIPLFERLVYRATRGNSIMRTDNIDKPFYNINANEPVYKSVFAVYFSAPRLHERLIKIAEANAATVYNYADSEQQLTRMHASLQQQVDTITQTLNQSAYRQRQVLLGIAAVCYEWRRAVVTEKAVFSTMNMLKFSGSTAIARGWAPVRSCEDIRTAIAEAEYLSGAQVATIIEELNTKETPPSYFKTNKITGSFQSIVDSYGMARYKEANPGVFTIITFPYLFGVMYGDVGHGIILTLFAAFLVFKEKSFEGQPLNEIFAMIFGGRYLLLLMGFFAVYMGLLYNDMFGFSIEIFASGYRWPQLPPEGPDGIVYPSFPTGRPSVKPESSVIFGIDSAWSETENKLEFYNSIKMKCSVIIGVAQMMAGVLISLTNYIYFNDSVKVWFRFVPEVVFLSCTFGYMCVLIIVKWLTTWENTHDAPSLLETMTNFFLAPGTITLPLFSGQAALQVMLLLVSLACVPCMLCVIPYVEKKEHDQKMQERAAHPPADGEEEGEDDFQLSEIIIHQIIHTIEYVLGCVSNTASYLRLWALSLAHSQLSEVFWSFAFLLTVDYDSGTGICIFFGFAMWMTATIGVLLGMESLSAFLHALRLHWVEFNNKFYAADGYAFEPFDLAETLSKLR
ncbi:putative vacuolar proton translocating ATPase subunit A [Leishmania major strain Friedlin]|uniref:V-type proton ATPase subunit a n=1 Tax=Leishmania major TaxID=5664 RepID=Q4QAY7_LEIMA|nr:putative vacuolar proton translocating ATPase subunit A [Leishmania major strain Friedlin]pir/T46719/ probable vacuolar ATPase (EC 3.6.1.-) proton pump chain 116K [imported] - Leishmania major [Leishmania major]CAG9574450.1 vacuolar_proton_translocating_ATPase_subunit_A_-_putative [Leishmania major strain Friedlin]CAJ05081.1 putative vacuolar proton translocating ATPase subunit A [Leishmania major strain Friedlin]|eukprot:XP_001683511.1 putative vacuolar proton translocating ATPase subunit A [Leishmania major strain Friedlin]